MPELTALPETGRHTYSFLLTDIQGSTRLWEKYPNEMNVALQAHDKLLRETIESHSGHVFKTMGDAFYACFSSIESAVTAAALCQQKMAEVTAKPDFPALLVRMAIHTGEAHARDNDYFGPSLNRVARLLAVGHGGQILLSSASVEVIGTNLPPGTELVDLGPHKLRDIEHAESIKQLEYPGMPESFPKLKTIDALPNNLPREVSTFVGRETELHEVRRLLATHRLLTLTGSGGSGKSRLAIEAAADMLGKFEHGVWLVELASLNDPSLLWQTIASTLGINEEPGKPIADTLRTALKDRTILFVIDNCEHLIDECAKVVDALLRSCANLRVMTTSREALGVGGEVSFKVPSLTVPSNDPDITASQLLTYSSGRLFVERATHANPSFELTDTNALPVAQICRRLDGIPLALELAAARIKSLAADQIAARLDDRFRLLTGGSRTVLPRQQTLRAAIDWSYNLLSSQEKILLLRLAVFSGGWTLEASEKVCSGGEIEEFEVLDLITQLVDKSLVTYDDKRLEPRYRFLETVRQYSREKLLETDEGSSLRRNHTNYFSELSREAALHFGGPDQVQWLKKIEAEHDNIRAALEWSHSDPDSILSGLKLATYLHRFWEVRGFLTEGRNAIESMIRVTPESEEEWKMRALNNVATLMNDLADSEAAQSALEQALAIAQKMEFKLGIAVILNNLGLTIKNRGDLEAAEKCYMESADICREINDERNLAIALDNLGSVYRDRGEGKKARELHEECLRIFRTKDDARSIAITLGRLAELDIADADPAAARKRMKEALMLQRELEYLAGIATMLELVSRADALDSNFEQSTRYLGRAAALREQIGLSVAPNDLREYEELEASLTKTLGQEEYARLKQEGRNLKLDAVLDQIIAS